MLQRILCLLLMLAMLGGCATYKTQYSGFRPPEGYGNHQQFDGITIGGEAFADKDVAEKAFGFDVRGAGLLPVQISLTNASGRTLEIVSNQTFLIDATGRYWNIIPNRVAVERVDKATELGQIAGGAGKGAFLGAAAGAILGAAIGIVSGENVGSAMGKGAAIGGAGGALIGGAQEGSSPEKTYRIADDIRDKGLEGKVIPSDYLGNGFIFFPTEAETAKGLRLQLRERESGRTLTFTLNF